MRQLPVIFLVMTIVRQPECSECLEQWIDSAQSGEKFLDHMAMDIGESPVGAA
jgi:hypothetical protein